MRAFGTTGHSFLIACGLSIALASAACSGDDDASSGSAGTTAGQGGATGGAGAGTGGSDAGLAGSGGIGSDCDVRGCWVSKEAFQAEALNCPDDYDAAIDELAEQPGEDCTSAFYDCGGLKGAAYQYGFTGDNVQCYYEAGGELVGGYRSSDHHAGTIFGEVPEPRCYTGPVCEDAGVPDAGVDPDALRACEVSSDCVLAATTCCPCGELTPDQVTAVHAAHQPAFVEATCPPPVSCPAIACPTPPARYVASCVAGRCQAIDLREDASTACEQAIDCRVRSSACCECGASTAPGQLVAVSDDEAFTQLVCDPQQGCPECEATYPDDLVISCQPAGRCELMDPREQF